MLRTESNENKRASGYIPTVRSIRLSRLALFLHVVGTRMGKDVIGKDVIGKDVRRVLFLDSASVQPRVKAATIPIL